MDGAVLESFSDPFLEVGQLFPPDDAQDAQEPAADEPADEPTEAPLADAVGEPAGSTAAEADPEPQPQPAPMSPAEPVGTPEAAPASSLDPVGMHEPLAESADSNSQVESDTEPLVFPMGSIIAVVNQKGGVGKTTTTINLGAALAEAGAKVLLVDLDPQGALSVGLGVQPQDMGLTVHDLLLDDSVKLADVIVATGFDKLDLVPANIDLSVAELQLVSEVAREQILRRKLSPATDTYNYVLIDCPPSLGLLTINALAAAGSVIIPLECEFFALRGLALLTDSVAKIQSRINPDLEIKGILPTMVDTRTIHSREVLSRVNDAYGDKMFKTSIKKTIKFAEAPVVGESILTYAPSSSGAAEYRDLAKEVISR